MAIEGQLQALAEKPELWPFADRVQDNEQVYGLLEGLQETISDYQVCS